MLKDRVRQLREAKNLTQEALAKLVGISQPSIAMIERGQTKTLAAKTLMGLAKALGEDAEYIRTGRRAAGRSSNDSAHIELVSLFNSLTPENRYLWLGIGRQFVQAQSARIVHSAGQDSGKKFRVDTEVSKTLRELMDTHGPSEVARALDNLQSTAVEPAAKSSKTGKTKA